MYTDSGVGAATEAETLRRTRRRKRKIPDGKRLDFSIGLVGTMFEKKNGGILTCVWVIQLQKC